MSSTTARKAAGTFIHDSAEQLPATLAWITQECRHGSLSGHVKRFCEFQQEILDTGLVLAESLKGDEINCRIPCKVSDCESPSTFDFDVCFQLNPKTGECQRA
jgi:hypothetical protein